MQCANKSLKYENGSATMIVIFVIFFIVILLSTFLVYITSRRNKQLQDTERLGQAYNGDIQEIYEESKKREPADKVSIKIGNAPEMLTGMEKIMFQLPEGNTKGKIIKENEQGFDSDDWYDYKEGKWANAQTEDGSMWVWIPRYAYKIIYNNKNNKSEGGTIDVKFLIGTSDEYYDENGEKKKAKRVMSKEEIADTTSDYYVHPAFTDESNIEFRNGGWDKELTGIWVAKFEAGYASGNNNAPVKSSSTKYTLPRSYIAPVESETGHGTEAPARNWLDGIYGETETSIKYPTFQGLTYSMNYIDLEDVYNISRVLTETGNIYGLSSSNADSHLMKNSEWGCVAYLGQSQYGLNGQKIYVNDVSLHSGNRIRTETQGKSGVDSVYAVTGVTTGGVDAKGRITTIENIRNIKGNTANSEGVYTWEQLEGQKASSTGNMYGVFDLSGALWEKIAAYIPTIHGNLKAYGGSVSYDGENKKMVSTKYTTVYPLNTELDDDINSSIYHKDDGTLESAENYLKNTKIFGDAVLEVSKNGKGQSAWNNEDAYYPAHWFPFFYRGGHAWKSTSWNGNYYPISVAGLNTFCRSNGFSDFNIGFRPVLVALN